MAINSGAPSFYITRDYAWKKLHERRRSVPPREKPHRRAMWEELEEAYERCRREHPEMDGWMALDMVLTHHNPSGFFLSEEYAWRLVRNLWRRPRKARSKNQNKRRN